MRPWSSPAAQRVQSAPPTPVRFRSIVQLRDGTNLGLDAETMLAFDEHVSFGPAGVRQSVADPAKWLANQIRLTAKATTNGAAPHRPILIAAPVAALAHVNLPVACDAAIRQTALTTQEVCLVFPDATFAGDPVDSTSRVARLRRLGFRVGIDMRKSWQTALGDGLRLMIDVVRVDARQLENDTDLEKVSMAACAAGIRVVADHARWRDADMLQAIGVTAAVLPRADA